MVSMQRDVRRRSVQPLARSQENKCTEMMKRRRHHSLFTSGEATALQITLARAVIDTRCSCLHEDGAWIRSGTSLRKPSMTFRFGNDETLETRTLPFLPVGIAGVNGGVACVCGAWVSAAIIVEGMFKRPWLPH